MFLDRLHQARELEHGRITLHWGAQIVAAAANTLLPPEPDFTHTTLRLHDARMSTHVGDVEIALDAAGVLQIRQQRDARTLPLAGLTLEQALAELAEGLQLFGLDVDALHRPEHPMPHHPVEVGEPFVTFPIEAIEVLRWLQTGNDLLLDLPRGHFGPTRLWPRHFDVARTWTVAGTGDDARVLTAGLSPGDEHYAEPYLYVTVWPGPAMNASLPGLPTGTWHLAEWTGAVLMGSQILEASDRRALCDEFLGAAIDAAAALLCTA